MEIGKDMLTITFVQINWIWKTINNEISAFLILLDILYFLINS